MTPLSQLLDEGPGGMKGQDSQLAWRKSAEGQDAFVDLVGMIGTASLRRMLNEAAGDTKASMIFVDRVTCNL